MVSDRLTDSAILKKIERQPNHSAGYKQLVRELGIKGDGRAELSATLQRLVGSGQLLKVDSNRYAIAQTSKGKNMVVGRLTMHRDGFGFVIPDASSLDAQLKSRLSGDIFIAPHAIGSAMHGDRVLVEIGTIRPDGRAEGRIIRPVVRAHTTVVGLFHYGPRQNYVTPIDQKISQQILIPPGMEYPDANRGETGTSEHASAIREATIEEGPTESKSSPPKKDKKDKNVHRVIGSEASHRSEWKDLENVVVDVEITDWPSGTQNPRGRVVEILGYQDDFGVDVEMIIRKFHLPHRFPPEVLEEAQDVEPIIAATEFRRRRDFRHLPIVTIDGETARDFDDAVLVEQLGNGNYELQVHIADVSQYVTPDSALDQEARLRGNSVYFPDRAVPMLPLELSTDICSLRPKVDRLVMSCVMEIDDQGEVVRYELCEGVIRSAERMTYTDVNAVLEGDAVLKNRYASLVATFEMMRDLALILNRKRQRRGSIDFDLPEPVIEFDEFGLMKSITRSERNMAHRLIEEFMLCANECVAQYLDAKHVASLHRVHEKPDAKRVYDFEVIAATFGYSLGVGALPIQRVQLKSERRASYGTGKRPKQIEVPKEVHITPRMYQKLTQKIAGKPEERILSFLMLRSLKQARYSEENLGHFALAATHYAHFTSPIRRYPDLIVHRILRAVVQEQPERRDGEVPVGVFPINGASMNKDISADFGKNASPEGATDYSPGRKPWVADHPDHAQAERRSSSQPTPWSKRRNTPGAESHAQFVEPIPLDELHDVADESSRAERRAAEAERELMEWKKAKFMEQHIGDDFDGLIISVTKFGFFVELTDLFVEGLVPLNTLADDHYTYHENTREIIGQRNHKIYSMGQRVRVIVDRIDPVEKKIQFALLAPPSRPSEKRSQPKKTKKIKKAKKSR